MRYILRVVYRCGMTKSSNRPQECRISAGEAAGSMNFGFDGRHPEYDTFDKLTFDSPLLEVKELDDSEGKLAFVFKEMSLGVWRFAFLLLSSDFVVVNSATLVAHLTTFGPLFVVNSATKLSFFLGLNFLLIRHLLLSICCRINN